MDGPDQAFGVESSRDRRNTLNALCQGKMDWRVAYQFQDDPGGDKILQRPEEQVEQSGIPGEDYQERKIRHGKRTPPSEGKIRRPGKNDQAAGCDFFKF